MIYPTIHVYIDRKSRWAVFFVHMTVASVKITVRRRTLVVQKNSATCLRNRQ